MYTYTQWNGAFWNSNWRIVHETLSLNKHQVFYIDSIHNSISTAITATRHTFIVADIASHGTALDAIDFVKLNSIGLRQICADSSENDYHSD